MKTSEKIHWLVTWTLVCLMVFNLIGQRWANVVLRDFADAVTKTLVRHEESLTGNKLPE